MIEISLKMFIFYFFLFDYYYCQTDVNNTTSQLKNLIVNGNFIDNSCQHDYCVWTSQRYNN